MLVLGQYEFLSKLGLRRKALRYLPIEVQAEFDRLGLIGARWDATKRRYFYDLTSPYRLPG
jgi:hypothetical protein